MSSPTGRQGVPARTRLKLLRPPATYLWAVAAVALGVALRTLLAPVLGAGFPFITFFPAIFVVAYLGGFGPTLFATILSALAVAYLFTHPVPILPLGDPAAQLGAALFTLSGIATGLLGESRLRAHLRAETAIAGGGRRSRSGRAGRAPGRGGGGPGRGGVGPGGGGDPARRGADRPGRAGKPESRPGIGAGGADPQQHRRRLRRAGPGVDHHLHE